MLSLLLLLLLVVQPPRQECSSKLLKLDWLKGKSPLPGGETGYTGGALVVLPVLLLLLLLLSALILGPSIL
jgi:hypothetical protein